MTKKKGKTEFAELVNGRKKNRTICKNPERILHTPLTVMSDIIELRLSEGADSRVRANKPINQPIISTSPHGNLSIGSAAGR